MRAVDLKHGVQAFNQWWSGVRQRSPLDAAPSRPYLHCDAGSLLSRTRSLVLINPFFLSFAAKISRTPQRVVCHICTLARCRAIYRVMTSKTLNMTFGALGSSSLVFLWFALCTGLIIVIAHRVTCAVVAWYHHVTAIGFVACAPHGSFIVNIKKDEMRIVRVGPGVNAASITEE